MTTEIITSVAANPGVSVSLRALIRRIGRKLRRDFKSFHKTPASSRWYGDLVAFYMVEDCTNSICGTHMDPEQLARELGVLRHGERVER